MIAAAVVPGRSQLDALRAELADLAFELERRGRLDAADAVNAVAARVDELRGEPDRGPDRRSEVLLAAPLRS